MKIQSFRKVLVVLAIAAGLSARVQADDNNGPYRHGGILNQGGILGTGIGTSRNDYYNNEPGLIARTTETVTGPDRRARRNERRENRRNESDKRNYNENRNYNR